MPELPEVETVANDLRPHLVGKRIERVDLRFPTIARHPEPRAFARRVRGKTIAAVRRRAKFIVMDLYGGEVLVVHLGMTGQLRWVTPDTEVLKHTHAIFDLDDGHQMRYRDARRFGRLAFGTEAELLAARALPVLGPEPLEQAFDGAVLHARLKARRAPIKAALLDQKVLAGIGNIYADEALHQAGIRPDRRAGSISRPRLDRLVQGLRVILAAAIVNRGSTVNSYLDAWGEFGRNQEVLRVYGRGGQPCMTCGHVLASTRIGGRTTVFCRRCQT